jgi:hypothetical protein
MSALAVGNISFKIADSASASAFVMGGSGAR